MAQDDFWNPDTTQQPQPQAQAPPRWSHHLANDPFGGAAGAWAKQFYDNPNLADPGAAITQQVKQFRSQYGDAADQGDREVIEMIASGRTPQAQQSPAQQWNAQPSGPTAGTGDALVQQLMERARQGTAVDRTDPTIRAQVDPYAANVERSRRNYLGDLAERAGPYANLRGEERMSAERAGQASGLFEAEVIGREVSARRDEIAQALQMWGSLLTNDQRMGLERELAMLNDRARTADRSTQTDAFLRELALREWMAMDDSDFRWQTGGV